MTSKISVRKIVLLSLIAVLLIVFIIQLAVSGRNDGYKLVLKDDIDTITIKNGSAPEIKLVNASGTWILKEGSTNPEDANQIIPANVPNVNTMTGFLSNIDVLGVVANSSDDERYGFLESGMITVTAEKEGNVLRTVVLGKNSSNYQQCYGKIDGESEVVLISGSPRTVFDKTFEELKAPIEEAEPEAESAGELSAPEE